MIAANANGAVELYYDSSKKAETDTFGFEVFGEFRVGGSHSHTHFNYQDGGNNYITQGNSSQTFFRNASGTVRTQIQTDGHWRWKDGIKAEFGDSDDLQIYHDGTNSWIANATGGLRLSVAGGSNQVQINKGTVDEQMAKFIADGAVELYHNNVKKFETTSAGVSVTGNLDLPDNTSGNASLRLGNSQDFFMNHNGTDSFIINNTGDLYIRDLNGDVHIQGKDSEDSVVAKADGAVELYYNNGKRFETTNNGAEITGRLEIDRGSAVEQAIDINTTGTTSASRIRFLESGTLKAQIAYSHGGDQIEVVGNAGQKAAFFTNGNQRLFIDTSGNIGFNRTNTNAGDSQTQASVANPNRVVFNNQYSNGYTDNSLKVYLFNDGATRQGFTSGPQYDIQYHSSGHATLTKHSFYTANTERLRINSDTNGRYLGRTPLNPAESAEEIKNDVSGTPDNDWYYIKQFGNVARLHYCVFKDKDGNDIAGGPWTMNWVAGVHPNQFSTNGSTALSQYLNLCKGIGIDKPGRGMENSRTTTQVYGAWLAVKRALWDLDPGFFEGATAASGGVLLMPLLNSNGEGGSSAHRLVYATGTATHIPPNENGDHCNANQLFCGWWGGNDFSSWATDNNSVPSPEDWGPGDAAHTGNIGAKSNSTTQKPSWRDLMLVTCVYK